MLLLQQRPRPIPSGRRAPKRLVTCCWGPPLLVALAPHLLLLLLLLLLMLSMPAFHLFGEHRLQSRFFCLAASLRPQQQGLQIRLIASDVAAAAAGIDVTVLLLLLLFLLLLLQGPICPV